MTEKAPVFDKIIRDYLHQIALIEAKDKVGASLRITVINDRYRIPFFNQTYTITTDKIVDEDGNTATHIASVILCKYLLLCPNRPTEDLSLVTYKDFRDAAHYVGGFRNTAEQPIAKYFDGALSKLEKRCLDLGGHSFDTEVSCQLAVRFQALPTVPVIL